MANREHLAWLGEGVEAWNQRWYPLQIKGTRADLDWADLHEAHLEGALFRQSQLRGVNFHKANLRNANLRAAYLRAANLREADLRGADLTRSYLRETDFRDANLSGAILQRATLVGADLRGADLTGCRVHGVSAWDLQLDEHTKQANLVITPENQLEVSVDNLKVAQFVYLLLENAEVRGIIDTVGKKAVLILGRFTPERKAVLDAIRSGLRERGYVPILFDFEGPASRDLTETVSTLAHLARFVIADLTDAKSLPQELQAIVPFLPSVPVQPLVLESQRPYALFEHLQRFNSVLPIFPYLDQDALLVALEERVIAPAEARARELATPRSDAV